MSTREHDSATLEDGFEIEVTPGAGREFFPWSITDKGKDLMLIDRLTGGMPPHEFFQLVEDLHERGRGPVLLALMATSVRARHQDWSVERITRVMMDLNLQDVVYVGGDEPEKAENDPPKSSEGADTPEPSPKPSELPVVVPETSSESQA
jgi:hypothetical protein